MNASTAYALILERDSPKPDAEIGRLLACHLDLHPTDAILRVRYGGGLIAEDLPGHVADELGRLLETIGVRARKIESDRWAVAPRGYRAFALAFHDDALEVRLITSRKILIPKREIFGLNVFMMAKEKPERPAGGSREEPASPRRSPLDDAVLSSRGRALVDNLAAAELGPVELHLTLHAAEPFGPVRVRRNDFDFSCLGPALAEHSIDNFLTLLEQVLAFLPDAWNRKVAARFLEDLDPKKILYFKPEEAENLDRWLLQWVRIETEAGREAP